MAGKPKAGFWIVVLLVAGGLVWYALTRSGLLVKHPATAPSKGPVATGASPSPPAAAGVIDLFFYTSSAKKNWIDEMVSRFNASDTRVDGRRIRVKAFHGNSGEQMDQIIAGAIKPDLWSPGDGSWLALASSHFRDVKNMTLYDSYDDLVNIPLVIAMWEPMARALGYPKPISWTDIAKLAADPRGWASLGNAHWGSFRWGHAHPDANSGFLTVVSEVYAAQGKNAGLTAEDLKDPKTVEFLRDFEGAVEHYGLSNSWIDDLMRQKGPSYLSAAAQYENTIIQSNEKSGNKPFKMVAIYPKDGCFWTRHPVAILNAPWVTPEKKEAARAFVNFLLSEEAQRRAMELGLRPIKKDLALGPPFDEAHGVILEVDDSKAFSVPDEAVLRRIRDLWEQVKVPASVVLVLDRSGSMKGAPLDNAKEGAIQFLKSMKPRDEVQAIVFNGEVTPLSKLCTMRDCGEQLTQQISGVFADGGTALYDAMGMAFKELSDLSRTRKEPRRYAVLVLSDGLDTASISDKNDFLDMLPRGEDFSAPKIFTIAYGDEADRDLLNMVANRTNARLFASTPSEIAKTYKELSANF
ncbi:MAG: extracellular solute-binding protein [Thermodesulfobacteriota bacterium]